MEPSATPLELSAWQVEDIQKGPGVERINNGEIIKRDIDIREDHVVITRYVGPELELTWDDLIYIVQRGSVRNQAIDYYRQTYGTVVLHVFCDRCKKVVDQSIGIDNKDLCLDCVAWIRNKIH